MELTLANKQKEEAFIGFLMFDNQYLNEEVCQLPSEAFYYESHRKIWTEMLRQYNEGVSQKVDLSQTNYISTLHLPETPTEESIELLLTWTGIVRAWEDNPDYHSSWPQVLAKQLRDLYYKRLIQDAANQGLSNAQRLSATETASKLANGVNDILVQIGKSEDMFSQPTLENLWVGSSHITTGFAKLDNAIRGFRKPGMTVLGARTSMGKSSLSRAIARATMYRAANVFWYALDQSASQLFDAEVANACDIPIDDFYDAKNSPKKQALIREQGAIIENLWNTHLTITSKNLELDEFCRIVTAQHQQKHLDLVIVDHIQLVPVKGNLLAYQRVTQVSHALKNLALDLEVTVLALAQLNRGAAEDKPPTLEDLKSSGAIEEDNDIVLLLHRPDYCAVRKGKPQELEEVANVFVAKNKMGAVTQANLIFCPRHAEFSDTSQGARFGRGFRRPLTP